MEGMMRKAVILGERKAGLVEMPIPKPKEDWVLVRMHVVPMCTEYKAWLHGGGTTGSQVNALGHEGAGEVVEVAQPCGVKVGDRVVLMGAGPCGRCEYCRSGNFIHCSNRTDYGEFTGEKEPTGAYAQYRLGSAWLCPQIPDDISYEKGSMAWCGLGPSFGAMQTMNVGGFDTVLIVGLGPVGLGAVVNASYLGARIIAVERVPWRMQRAKEMGEEIVLSPDDPDIVAQIKAQTDGLGVTCALDCAGVVASERLCIDATRAKGKVCFIAECSDDLPIKVSPDMIRKGLTIIGQWHYSLNDFPMIMQVIRESPLLDLLISHRFPMSQVQEALALSATHQCGKILLDPWR